MYSAYELAVILSSSNNKKWSEQSAHGSPLSSFMYWSKIIRHGCLGSCNRCTGLTFLENAEGWIDVPCLLIWTREYFVSLFQETLEVNTFIFLVGTIRFSTLREASKQATASIYLWLDVMIASFCSVMFLINMWDMSWLWFERITPLPL